jgi:anti-anti-sigma factor
MPADTLFLTERDGNTLILTPTVNLSELEYAESVADGIIALLGDATIKNVVIDFERTDYFGSTALGFFIRIWKILKERQGRVAFCNLSAHEAEILHITKLTEYWSMHATRTNALEAIKK